MLNTTSGLTRNCLGCQTSFQARNVSHTHCSRTCYDRAYRTSHRSTLRTYQKEWARNYRKDNPVSKETRKDWNLRTFYGLTLSQYEALLREQEGLCAICHSLMVRPNVDHDHFTGKVRELLCGHCNTLLGRAKDSEEILQKAVAYLRKHRA